MALRKRELVTSTNYARPHRPAAVRLYNRAGASAPLDAGSLFSAARTSVGLDDFGDLFFLKPLEVLVDAMEREARLHPLGRAIMRGRLVSMLENRLRIEALHREHPS